MFPAGNPSASNSSTSPAVKARQQVWRRLSHSALTLCLFVIVGATGALWFSLQRELPFKVLVAKYENKSMDFNNPKEVLDTWQALPGCVRMADGSYWPLDAISGVACSGTPTPEGSLPTGLSRLEEVFNNRRHSGAEQNPPAKAQGQTAPQGHSVQLTIDPKTQELAQAHADCFTGVMQACAELGIDMANWRDHFEQAAARSAGVLILDVATGDIQAMGSAMSPCYKTDNSSTVRAPGCPDLPQDAAVRPYMTSSRALGEAMMASTNKIVLSLALLRDPQLGPQLQSSLRAEFLDAIKHSRNEWFLDKLFCRDTGFGICDRPRLVLQAAKDLGLNNNCTTTPTTTPTAKCGKSNLLGEMNGDTDLDKLQYPVMAGRVFTSAFRHPPASGAYEFQEMTDEMLRDYPKKFLLHCSQSRWEECRGESVINLKSEALGQGNNLGTPMGVAAMVGQLARAANTQPGTPVTALSAHLMHINPQSNTPATVSIRPEHARLILEGMGLTTQRGGSAYNACVRAMSPTTCALNRVAGKTGTPTFSQFALTLPERKTKCKQAKLSRSATEGCRMLPIKWYVAAVKSSADSATWDKVVVVLCERNFNQRTGLVDSPNERNENLGSNVNVSAELGLRLIRRLYLDPPPQQQNIIANPL